MKMTEMANGDIVIRAPKVQPHVKRTSIHCSACGEPAVHWLTRLARSIRGKKPMAAIGASYCAGSKPLSEQNGNLFESAFMGKTENVHPCAGIDRPHIHVKCFCCGHSWFTETKEAIR